MGDANEPEPDDSAGPKSPESPSVRSGTKTEAKAKKDGWDILQALSPLITGVALALIGYWLTGVADHAVKRSQLQFDYVKEMQELLVKLGDRKTTQEEAKTTAVALAAFGSYSIPPLLNEIQSGELNRPVAGEYGLRAVALADPTSACPALGRVLENRTAAYNWLTHRAAIRILGSANCQIARPVLADYQSRLNRAASTDGFTAFQETLAADPAVTKETVDQLKSEMDKSLKLLEQGRLQY
jgi:hypothetical protein